MTKPEKAAQSVARRIAHDIAARRLPEGAMLPPESTMSAQHRVSRSTLREALRLLESQGLISIKAGRGGGPVVRRVDAGDVGRGLTLHFLVRGATFAELVRARLAIEPVLAGLAAENRSEADVDTLKALLKAETGEDRVAGDDGYIGRVASFHDAVMAMSGNFVLEIYASALAAIFQSRVSTAVFPEDARHRVHASHREIAEAIIAKNVAAATDCMRAHMDEFVTFWKAQYPGILNEVIDWQ